MNDPDDPRLKGVPFIKGDCRRPELLERAGLSTARGVVIVTSDDLVNVSTALLVRQLNPDVRVVLRMFNQNLIPRFGAAVRNMVALSVSALTAPLIALTALTGDALGAFKLEDAPQQVAELLVTADSPLIGKKLSAIASSYKLLIFAHKTADQPMTLWHTTPGDIVVAAGDTIVACGSPENLAPLTDSDRDDLLGNVLWAGWIRRQFRTVRRSLLSIDLSVKLASLGLFLILFLSTLVFRFGVGLGWAEGIYRTVSIVATGGDLHGENRDGWVKVFLSILKVAGAALLAVFTAIITQYLIRARLGGALEMRKIPDSGHIVVIGLGNVGYRCVEELVKLGHSVVAIESVNDNPFAATVRRMGVPVIVGDATIPEVLRQARANTARSVIASTESELVNLEVALLVREENPSQRVVVRLNDPAFADTVRSAANIKHAVSVPSLAAPAFVAALFGDRVQTLVTVGERTVAIVEILVQPNDPCLNEQTLVSAMIDYRFLPIGLSGRAAFATDGVPKNVRLREGDHLTVAIDVPDMEKLLRRTPVEKFRKVIVDSYPITARAALTAIARLRLGDSQNDVSPVIGATPFTLASDLTQGEADELASLVSREKVEAHVE